MNFTKPILFLGFTLALSAQAFVQSKRAIISTLEDIKLSLVAEKVQRVVYQPKAKTGIKKLDWAVIYSPKIKLSEKIPLGGSQVNEVRFDGSNETSKYLCQSFGFGKPLSIDGVSREIFKSSYVFFMDGGSLSLRKQEYDNPIIETLVCEGKDPGDATTAEKVRAELTAVKHQRLSFQGGTYVGILTEPALKFTPALAGGESKVESIAVQNYGKTKEFVCVEFGYTKFSEFSGITEIVDTENKVKSFYTSATGWLRFDFGSFDYFETLTCKD